MNRHRYTANLPYEIPDPSTDLLLIFKAAKIARQSDFSERLTLTPNRFHRLVGEQCRMFRRSGNSLHHEFAPCVVVMADTSGIGKTMPQASTSRSTHQPNTSPTGSQSIYMSIQTTWQRSSPTAAHDCQVWPIDPFPPPHLYRRRDRIEAGTSRR